VLKINPKNSNKTAALIMIMAITPFILDRTYPPTTNVHHNIIPKIMKLLPYF
jgi:hypothetical protein